MTKIDQASILVGISKQQQHSQHLHAAKWRYGAVQTYYIRYNVSQSLRRLIHPKEVLLSFQRPHGVMNRPILREVNVGHGRILLTLPTAEGVWERPLWYWPTSTVRRSLYSLLGNFIVCPMHCVSSTLDILYLCSCHFFAMSVVRCPMSVMCVRTQRKLAYER